MSCQQVVELVSDYFDDALSPEDRARFEQHIEECVWCARYLEQMRVTVAIVGRLDEQSISPKAKDALLDAFRDWNAERQAS
jgi:anti-sigma factor RsiW